MSQALAANKIQFQLSRNLYIIDQLITEGRYHGVDKDITDYNYPIPLEKYGLIEMVTFCIVPGKLLKRADGIVYRSDVEAAFREEGMRFCDPAEALLPPAKDQNLGLNDAPYVAYLRGLKDSFFISGGPTRGLKRYDDERCGQHCVLVGVCEK